MGGAIKIADVHLPSDRSKSKDKTIIAARLKKNVYFPSHCSQTSENKIIWETTFSVGVVRHKTQTLFESTFFALSNGRTIVNQKSLKLYIF